MCGRKRLKMCKRQKKYSQRGTTRHSHLFHVFLPVINEIFTKEFLKNKTWEVHEKRIKIKNFLFCIFEDKKNVEDDVREKEFNSLSLSLSLSLILSLSFSLSLTTAFLRILLIFLLTWFTHQLPHALLTLLRKTSVICFDFGICVIAENLLLHNLFFLLERQKKEILSQTAQTPTHRQDTVFILHKMNNSQHTARSRAAV
jgi:hypothetical protein